MGIVEIVPTLIKEVLRASSVVTTTQASIVLTDSEEIIYLRDSFRTEDVFRHVKIFNREIDFVIDFLSARFIEISSEIANISCFKPLDVHNQDLGCFIDLHLLRSKDMLRTAGAIPLISYPELFALHKSVQAVIQLNSAFFTDLIGVLWEIESFSVTSLQLEQLDIKEIVQENFHSDELLSFTSVQGYC